MDRRLRRDLLVRLLADARAIASHFELEFRAIEAERANVKSRYGICYDDGTIRIRLAHAVSGKPLKYSSLVSTLCHELAHLRHFDHSPNFRAFYAELLAWARTCGIYRPGTAQRAESVREAVPDLATAIRAGRVPTLRESLESVLGSRSPDTKSLEPGSDPRNRPDEPPGQLELFAAIAHEAT